MNLSDKKIGDKYHSEGKKASLAGQYDIATSYYEKGVAINHFPCMLSLSGRLMDKRGSHWDPNRSIELVLKAAEFDYPEALCTLGDWYSQGYGYIEINHLKALKYYSKSAEQRYPEGIRNLALIYLQGPKEFQNVSKGIELLERAGRMGYPPAFFTLANVLWTEAHKKQPSTPMCNKVEAIAWMIMARETGDKRAADTLRGLNSGLGALFFKKTWRMAENRANQLLSVIEPFDHHDFMDAWYLNYLNTKNH